VIESVTILAAVSVVLLIYVSLRNEEHGLFRYARVTWFSAGVCAMVTLEGLLMIFYR
jgi:hypothetical protein